jgi:uncharacterized cupredoxin-like copper-binding protein
MVLVVVAAALAASQAQAHAGQAPEQARTAHATALLATVHVTATEFKFVLSSKTAKRGIVIFKLKNVGKLGHDFSISGRKTRVISPGASTTLRVTFLRKGHYSYSCTVPGHAAAGMKGVFTIT